MSASSSVSSAESHPREPLIPSSAADIDSDNDGDDNVFIPANDDNHVSEDVNESQDDKNDNKNDRLKKEKNLCQDDLYINEKRPFTAKH